MSISHFFTVPIVISNPGTTTVDAEGAVTVSPSTVTTVCHVQPYRAGDSDQVLGVEEATRAKTVWLPLATTITHKSTASFLGDEYEMVGAARDWRVGSPNDHLETTMVRVLR